MEEVDQRTEDDKIRSRDIMDASQPEEVATLVFEYYRDNGRADRTPRSAMYLHMGLLCGAVIRACEKPGRTRRKDLEAL